MTAKHSIRAGYKLSNETSSPPEGLSVGTVAVDNISKRSHAYLTGDKTRQLLTATNICLDRYAFTPRKSVKSS